MAKFQGMSDAGEKEIKESGALDVVKSKVKAGEGHVRMKRHKSKTRRRS